MKRTGSIRTMRGTFGYIAEGFNPFDFKANLVIDDGRLNVGYRVLEFRVFPQGFDVNSSWQANLGTDSNSTAGVNLARVNTQIGWTVGNHYDNMPLGILDPDHIVNRDLVVTIKRNLDFMAMNYLIVLEEILLTDDEAIITLLKNESQDFEQ